ncbi:MAG: VTT domain-containing protein [Clostridiales bacterium]|jgi:uncharacterized membrane protein YdjX (TVP38/TMEM64 family)|nr:VTT domain-containing protein [Clostridiales bacterium]
MSKKTNMIIAGVSAIILTLGGLLLMRDWITVGLCISALSVALFIFFLIVHKKQKETLIRLTIFIYISGVFIIIILLALSYLNVLRFIAELGQEELEELIQRSFAPRLIFALIQFLQVTFLPLPSVLPTAVGTLLFGWESIIWSLLGVWAGSFLAFAIGRKFGLKVAIWIAGKETIDKYYNKVKGRDKTLLFMMFLLPGFPDDILCIIAGLTNMKWNTFVVMMLISRPIQVASTVAGMLILSNTGIVFEGWGIAFWIAVAIILLALTYFILKYNEKIEKRYLIFAKAVNEKKRELKEGLKKAFKIKKISNVEDADGERTNSENKTGNNKKQDLNNDDKE